MNIRLSTTMSCALHGTLLAMLALLTFRQAQLIPPPRGMELELTDMQQAMTLPHPEVAKAPAAAQVAQPQAQLMQAQPQIVPTPPSRDPIPSESQRTLGPGPVAQITAPEPVQMVSPRPLIPVAPAPPAPPRPRLDTNALSQILVQHSGQGHVTRIDSGAIGSAIGKAAPRGAAGISARQKANLEEMIRSQITPCWSPPPAEDGAGNVSVLMRIQLSRDGRVVGSPAATAIRGETAGNAAYARNLAGSVRRAILRCSPLKLPPELFEAWSDVDLNFDPKDIS